jgi:hypothetical protein
MPCGRGCTAPRLGHNLVAAQHALAVLPAPAVGSSPGLGTKCHLELDDLLRAVQGVAFLTQQSGGLGLAYLSGTGEAVTLPLGCC